MGSAGVNVIRPLCDDDMSAPHCWWPRPDVGTDVVRCSACQKTTTEAKLTPGERAEVFAVNVVRLFASLGRKSDDLTSFAREQWKVYVSQRRADGMHERRFWTALEAAARVVNV